MNLTLKSALIELRSDGVSLDPIADLEYILTLDKLSRKISEPFSAGSDAPLLLPVLKIGNVTLRRLSLGAQCFLADVVTGWIPDDVAQQDLAYIYCMIHEPEALWPLQHDRAAFLKAVKAWARGVTVSVEELCTAVKRFLSDASGGERPVSGRTLTPRDCRDALGLLARLRPLPEAYRTDCEAAVIALETEEAEKGHGYGQLIEILTREYGHDAEYWFWKVSADQISVLMSARNEKLDAEARAIKGAQDDRMQRAHYAFTQYVELVRKLKKGIKP